ncbi:uncharacterized protein [Eucyclogobius newberryi]|uniref:uncharacterized protein n=1 Tax=Eucyclogobius newberryi TaxID=166745 RepID=UPI003B5B3D41
MAPQTSALLSLLLLLLPRPSRLYSLHNCSLDRDDLRSVNCKGRRLTQIPRDVPTSALSLSVRQNNLTRLQQNDLSGLGELRTLNLAFNQISDIEPGAFSHSPALTHLSLQGNKLTNLPADVFDGLSDLTCLHLGGNPVKYISKSAFGPLKNLQELHLSGNSLSRTSHFANILLSCPALQVLHLEENHMTSFESKDFPFPLNITDLDLSSNPLRKFTVDANTFPRLKSLRLSTVQSNLQWDVSNNSFLQNLTTLDLNRTNFTIETYESIFRTVSLLENLVLSTVVSSLKTGLLDFACAIPSLKRLDLSCNVLSVLDDALLLPCSDVADLDLSSNELRDLSRSSLRKFTRLSRLEIERNSLTRVPETIRNISTLAYLSFLSNLIAQLECSAFSGLWRLKELILSDNRLFELNSCVFDDLLSLRKLHLERNFIYTLDNSFSVTLGNLLVLNAEDNIDILHRGVFMILSSLRELTVGKSLIMNDGVFEGLGDLRYLSYSPGLLSTETGAGLGSASRWRSHSPPPTPPFIDMSLLQTLIITFKFSLCPELPRDILKGLDHLTTFSSTHFFCKPHPEMFHYTPRLLSLEITKNSKWENPDPELFKPIRDLQKLDLSENRLKSVDIISEANLTKLERLVLANNELRIIDETVFETFPSLRYLDLSGNLFVCDCSNAGFISWVLSDKRVYVADAFRYRCSFPLSHEGQLLLSFNVQSCWESMAWICFVTSFSLVLLALLSSFTYHFLRWQLVYSYYLFRAFLYDGKKKNEGSAPVYDAFVSYNVHDEEWIYHKLVPELEERQGWKLCLHHRDFEPGREILENITDAIYSSRKTLCVISPQYLQSEWCSREIQMASFRLFDEQKDVLILLFLEEISSDQLSPFYRMRKLVRSRTYLSWTQARSHRGLFWERVRRALETGNDPRETHDPLTANA